METDKAEEVQAKHLKLEHELRMLELRYMQSSRTKFLWFAALAAGLIISMFVYTVGRKDSVPSRVDDAIAELAADSGSLRKDLSKTSEDIYDLLALQMKVEAAIENVSKRMQVLETRNREDTTALLDLLQSIEADLNRIKEQPEKINVEEVPE